VPMGMIQRQFGKAIKFDEINEITNRSLNEYIYKEKIGMLGNPLPIVKDIDIEADDFQFQFEIGLAPTFEVNLKPAEGILRYEIEVDEPQIDKQTGQIITQDTPLFIEWIPFKLYISANEKCDQNHYKTIIKDHGIDIQIVDNIMDATHYYYDSDNNDIKEEEQKDEFKLAIIKGIPVLNSQWLQKVLGHDNEDGYNSVKDWLLDIDYKKYLPKKDDHYLPKSYRLKPLNNVKLVSLERINWLETIIIDFKVLIQQQEDVLKSKIGDNQFILIVPTTMATTLNRHNFQKLNKKHL